MIRYSNIVDNSVVDGKGIRLVIFLQGCELDCPGCHNQELQKLDGGTLIEEELLADILLKKLTPLHQGITISGGEPTLQWKELAPILKRIKMKRPELDFWLYSGSTFEKIKSLENIELIDILVDGPFLIEQKDLNLPFRGSKNQRIIDVQDSLNQGKVIELNI